MKKLSLVFFIMLIAFVLFKCNQQAEPEKLTELDEFPEVLMVKKSSFNSFYDDLVVFSQGLTISQKALLENYVDTKRMNAKTNTEEPTCNCTVGQSTCSADGLFSSCCVCCPNNKGMNCRVTVGVAICECEDSPPPAKRGANQEEDMVLIKPRGINDMFNFATQNGINVANIKKSLTELVKSDS